MEVYGAKKDESGNKHGPYHLSHCPCVNKKGVVPENWTKYPNEESALSAGHEYKCPICFGKNQEPRQFK